ncbi:hypothetical protein V7S43_001644 [Phytophthora oleae]|uniref:U1-type domain-containing protein n=1 Tax=Phytophthora oleae TaxID=2107226 RepID=A0ABD3G830_9STRA
MDAQRALLDSLMGLNRDGDRPDEATMDFRHPKVCKPYLCGLCPHDLFQNTRLDTGACKSLHLPSLRSAYEEQTPKRDFGYERALASELSKLLADVEKKIARAQRRLVEDGEDLQDRTQILQLTQDMQDAALQAEQAKDGGADKSLQMMEKVELLKRKRRELLRQSNTGANGADVNQKLRVCDVCGAFLSIFDNDKRLADHFGGKVHVGYVKIREKLKQLMEKTKEKQVERRRSVSRSRKRQDRPRREENRESRRRSRSRERRRSRERNSRRHHRRSMSSSRSRSRSQEHKRRRSRRHRH